MPDPTIISHSHDPNFPQNLHIHPSDRKLHSCQHLDPNDFNEASFGSKAQELAIRKYGIAGRVWEAAYMMILYLQPAPYLEFDPPMIDALRSSQTQSITMIELGSGTGFVASYLSRLLVSGSDCLIVTDLPEVCPLLEDNLIGKKDNPVLYNTNQGSIIVRPLSWGVQEDVAALASEYFQDGGRGSLTHIICSDLVYFPELLAPLLRSLLHLTSPPFLYSEDTMLEVVGPQVLISYKVRSLEKETAFWSAFGLWFQFSPVLVKDNRIAENEWQRFGADFEDTSFLFIGKRRAESLTWTIPRFDSDLLAGIGANRSDSRKGDDTFEKILLLTMEQ